VIGGPDKYVALSSLADSDPIDATDLAQDQQVTATLEWKLPRETGNAVQGDGVQFAIDFGLEGM
jgi:hypothetical protein